MTDNRYKEPSNPVDRSGNGGLAVVAIFAAAATLGIVAYVVMSNDTREADAVEAAAERVGDAAQNTSTTVPAPPPANGPPIQINVPAPAASIPAAPTPTAPAPAASTPEAPLPKAPAQESPVSAPEATPPTQGTIAPSDSEATPPKN